MLIADLIQAAAATTTTKEKCVIALSGEVKRTFIQTIFSLLFHDDKRQVGPKVPMLESKTNREIFITFFFFLFFFYCCFHARH